MMLHHGRFSLLSFKNTFMPIPPTLSSHLLCAGVMLEAESMSLPASAPPPRSERGGQRPRLTAARGGQACPQGRPRWDPESTHRLAHSGFSFCELPTGRGTGKGGPHRSCLSFCFLPALWGPRASWPLLSGAMLKKDHTVFWAIPFLPIASGPTLLCSRRAQHGTKDGQSPVAASQHLPPSSVGWPPGWTPLCGRGAIRSRVWF